MPHDRQRTVRLLVGRLHDQKTFVIIWCLIIALGIGLDVVLLRMVKYFTDDVLVQKSSAEVQASLSVVQTEIEKVHADASSIQTGLSSEHPDLPFIQTILARAQDDLATVEKGLSAFQPDLSKVFPAARKIVLLVVLIIFMQGIQKGSEILLTNRVGQRLIMDLRQSIFNHLQDLSLDFFESHRTGQIMSWITTDVLRIREFAGKQVPELVRGPFALIAYLGVMFYSSWRLTLASMVILPVVVFVVQSAAKRTRRAALKVQGALAEVSGELQEEISAIQIVRSFANEAFEILKFHRVNLGAYKSEMRRARIEAMMVPVLNVSGAVGLGLLLLYGAFQVGQGIISAGDLVMIIAFLRAFSDEANKLGRQYMGFQDTLAAADRIFDFLDIDSSIREKPDCIAMEKCRGNVEFKNVSFSYQTGEEVLHDVSITADPGRVVAIVGPSGAGKSTIAKLVPRFYDVTRGQVTIDGIDVKDLTLLSLRKTMGIVPQETILFHGTVKENIAYGKLDATNEEIERAAKDANAHDFILRLENGYETVVGERGVKLSGGQRQRISIARALLKDPKILILDEATSNLDTESEKLVQGALERLMQGRTTFVIAHRLSTIRNADEIIVLQAGRIVDRGTHEELFNRPGIYRELYVVEGKGGVG